MFPTAEMLGIDLVLPDFSYLRERADDIEAIVLTHGHEDHVGALPYVLREIGMPPAIYGGPLTIGLVRSKLEEHKIKNVPFEVIDTGEVVQAGPFGIEMVRMSHSIPDSRAVAIETAQGKILITGDYKFDQTPVDSEPADMSRLAALGAEGLLCLFGDSTNADQPGVAPSESSVGPALLQQFARCDGRIIVTCFASNVHRVQQVIDAAAQLDRKVALVGRSMRKNFNIASNLGIAKAPEGLLIQPKEIENFPDEKVIAISTGSQGEPLSALRRMAVNDHRDVELHSGDTVVFSATPVPGNERSVNETIDRIYDIGAKVITANDAPIHASGPRPPGGAEADAQPDQAPLRDAGARRPPPPQPARRPRRGGRDRPRPDLPGTQRGRARDRRQGRASCVERTKAGMIFVDGVDIGDPDDVALRDRRELSADGVFIVVATVSSENGDSVTPPEIIFRGVPFLEDAEADGLLDEVREVVEDSLDAAAERGSARAGPPAAGPPRRHRQVRLRPAAPPADDLARSRRGIVSRCQG